MRARKPSRRIERTTSTPRVRGLGSGRRTRRTLSRGGAGAAQRLNDALGGWAGVRIMPMFGRWGYFANDVLFGCFPLRVGDADLWIRLPISLQARALAEPGLRPHRRFARRGWVEMQVGDEADDVARALRWLRRAHAAATTGEAPESPGE